MSMDTIDPAHVSATIYAGATFRVGWTRVLYPYPTAVVNGVVVRKSDGSPAPASDGVPDDYTGCTAIMELRDADTKVLLTTLSTATGDIDLFTTPGRLGLYLSHAATGALTPFTQAIGHVEVRRPWGDVERQYEATFDYSKQETVAEPPTP